eukprot:COSAG02_NODE_3781_length_6236_cov_12.839661_7_plen_94_part_00
MEDSHGERTIWRDRACLRLPVPTYLPACVVCFAERLHATDYAACAVVSSVPGTHKSNLRGPASLYSYDEHQDLVYQENCKAGDVMIFTEALTQ